MMKRTLILALAAVMLVSCGQGAQQESDMKKTVEIKPEAIKENAI